MTSIVLPEVGRVAVRMSVWFVRPGDRVYEGDRVAEVVIPGACIDIPAPATGTIAEQFVRPNDSLAPGQPLGTLAPDPDA